MAIDGPPLMGTVPLPPWLRRIQQTWYWQNFALPIGVGFLGSFALQGCLSDIFNIQANCIHIAINSTVTSLLTAWVKGHSVGSSDFKSNGTPLAAAPKLKEMVDVAAMLELKAADPTSNITPDIAKQVAASVTQTEQIITGTADAITKATNGSLK